jgi:hypothetical protein
MYKMDDQGEIQFMYLFGARAKDSENYDICRAINWDVRNREIVMMLEVTSKDLRPDYYLYEKASGKYRDILILTMKDDGRLTDGFNINMHDGAIDLYIGGNSMFTVDNHYISGGYSWGYNTRYQNETYDKSSP